MRDELGQSPPDRAQDNAGARPRGRDGAGLLITRQLRRGLLLCAASAVSGAAARADLTPAFTGTIVSTYPDGRKAELWLNPDGSYTAEGRRHDHSQGHWKIQGERICLRQSHPPTLPIAYCTAIPAGGVGSSWSAKSVTGDPIEVRLENGGR